MGARPLARVGIIPGQPVPEVPDRAMDPGDGVLAAERGDRLEDAGRSLGRLNNCIRSLKNLRDGRPYADLDQLLYDIKQGFISGLDDDLNISTALASIFKVVKKVNSLVRDGQIDAAGAGKIIDAFRSLNSVLNLLEFEDAAADPAVQAVIAERQRARSERNWPLADRLREQLREMGVVVQDGEATEKGTAEG